MNVLFVYYIPSGGVETLNRQRCNALMQAGVSCELLYMQHGTGYSNITDIPVHVTNEDSEIKKLIATKQYSAIMVCSDHLFLKRVRELGYNGTLLYEIQGLGTEIAAECWMKQAKDYVQTYANAIFYPHTSHLEKLCQTYLPDIQSFSFHNCFDTSLFHYTPPTSKPSLPIIGWVGRLEPNKNWLGFLKLVSEVRRKQPQLKVWMFQDSTLASAREKANFYHQIQKLNLGEILTSHSTIPHKVMPSYYSAIGDSGGFLCSTSQLEGFGYAVVEAMSCDCPVVSTDSDGVRSFLIHNQTGKEINLHDLSKASDECLDIMTNAPLRKQLVLQARNHIEAILDPTLYCQNFVRMIEQIRT